ncbi:hypothetical protein B0J12DRAFT_66214 [Macrophomina phaseolina]|uniref:Uncharacterized protein n=1 Tax=Macrophomina phaseolina TaxID=35725 RepID=A0ABQ8GFR9_9PEZI|nr:hypothetical protein B0J12DRAFT_66214 [Macrophomina phaseolina]
MAAVELRRSTVRGARVSEGGTVALAPRALGRTDRNGRLSSGRRGNGHTGSRLAGGVDGDADYSASTEAAWELIHPSPTAGRRGAVWRAVGDRRWAGAKIFGWPLRALLGEDAHLLRGLGPARDSRRLRAPAAGLIWTPRDDGHVDGGEGGSRRGGRGSRCLGRACWLAGWLFAGCGGKGASGGQRAETGGHAHAGRRAGARSFFEPW